MDSGIIRYKSQAEIMAERKRETQRKYDALQERVKSILNGGKSMSASSEKLDEILKRVAKQFDLSSEKWDDDYSLRQAEIKQLYELLNRNKTEAIRMKLNVKIKRLNEDAVIPKYAREGDAGFDLIATSDVIIEPGETKLVPTGLAFELPPGYEMQIRPRSGVTLKTKLRVQLGTIDSGYRGEVGVIVDNVAPHQHVNMPVKCCEGIDGKITEIDEETMFNAHIVRKGDRICQAVIAPVESVKFVDADVLDESMRGGQGFGSTGVK